jgi:enterochelin esterase-like enzyme
MAIPCFRNKKSGDLKTRWSEQYFLTGRAQATLPQSLRIMTTITKAPEKKERLYRTSTVQQRTLRLAYPAGRGRIVLRTQMDWDKDVEPVSVSEDGNISTFKVAIDQPFLYFKPCLIDDNGEYHWSVGANKLLLMEEKDQRIAYPYFFGSERGRYSELVEFPSKILGRTHYLRVYLPPGYDENTLATYAVAFMQDGQNLFFPEEAFMGQTWEVDETSQTLRRMGAMEDVVIVGIRPGDRMEEYTKPGYEKYARSLAEEIVPLAEQKLRIGKDRRYRSVWGSSLGGVVSFYTVWQHPDVFGVAVCMSGTFSHKDDLIERVMKEPAPDVAFYLDSGWPEDNYEVTMAMAMALVSRGWKYGYNLFHLSFPHAGHDESSWGLRLHLPMQFLNGAVARAARISNRVLGDTPFVQNGS